MTPVERVFVIIALYVIAFGLLLHAFNGRYAYCPGQNNIHNIDYSPKTMDTWTGKFQNTP